MSISIDKMSTQEFVNFCFKTVLGRNSDESVAGCAFHAETVG
jgi:hypothetical protein